MSHKIAIIYGTRPEFLKVFPVINQFHLQNKDILIVNTGQHDDLLSKMEET